MPLQPGQKLGPYEIIGALGAGGMGEVYRARDTRLERDVAIKVLPEHLTANDTARQRLEREAKAVSALSHPHICTLYDIGHEDGVDYLVIEYLEGETLAERLDREPLGTTEILEYAIQIADGLDKAHKQGVVHRDLKPGNVMLAPQGAKLLDFGLAKTVGGPGGASNLTVAPTATSPLTAEGTIVGTFQYMAPEQLEGQEADVRSDIFAFGTVLFEMITNRRAFEGKTQAGVIAAIIERDPPAVSTVQPLAPPALDRLVQTCLAKNPDERRQSMHDVLLDLRWIAEAGSQAGVPAPVTRRRRHRANVAWVVAAVFAIASVAMAWTLFMRPTEAPARIVSRLTPPEGVTFTDRGLALSPDGRRLAFTASEEDGPAMLWVRQLDSGISRALPGTEDARFPFWSPDSRSIGFFASGELRRIHVSGETSLRVCSAGFGIGGSWNEDGVIVFSPSFGSGLQRVSAAGGEPVEVTEVENTAHMTPVFLPDGNRFLYFSLIRGTDSRTVRVGSLDGSVDVELGPSDATAAYSGGHLLYVNDDTLIAQPIDLTELRLRGDPRVVAEPISDYHVNARGMLIYVSEQPVRGSQLTGYNREGQEQSAVISTTRLDDLALSHDGERLAMSRGDPDNSGSYDVWTYDLNREIFTRVTFDKQADDPVWSPDGKWIIYSRNPMLYRVRSNGAGEPELVLDSEVDDVCHDWSRDGKQVLFSRWVEGDDNQLDLWSLAIDEDAEPRRLLSGSASELQAEFSPDGRWLAYASEESGDLQVYVMSWPDLTEKWQVSRAGGAMPRWRADGRELYYISLESELTAVEITARASDFRVGSERVLFGTRTDPDSRSTDYVVTPDGERFLFIETLRDADRGPVPMMLVQEFLTPVG